MNDRLTLWLKELHPIWFVLLLTSVSLVALVPFTILVEVFPFLSPGPGELVAKQGFYELVFASVFFVPLLETALYQALPIELLSRKTSFTWQAKVIISAMLFGAAHWYSWGYVLITFLVGLTLAYGYVARRRKGGKPFLLIFLVHGLRNAISLTVFALGVPYPS